MNKDSQPQQEQDSFSAQDEIIYKMASIIPSDTVQLTKSLFDNMEKEYAKELKEDSIARLLPTAKKICDFYELFFSNDDNKLSDSLCQLDYNQLSKSKKRKYELFVKELTELESEIEQDKLIAHRVLNSLMEDISICVNLQKTDYPETKDHISILRDVDFQYGQLNHPIPLSVFVNVFILIKYFTNLTSKAIKAKEKQDDIFDLFKNNDSETAELVRKLMEDQSKLSNELKTKTQDIITCAFSQLEKSINKNIWASTNLVTIKINKNEINKRRSKLNQKTLAEHIIIGFCSYCKKYNIKDIKTPGVDTIVKLFNRWNGYIKSSDEPELRNEEDKPYTQYESILFADTTIVENWAIEHFAPEYIEMIRKKKELKNSKKIDALDRPHAESNYNIDEKIPSENNDVYFDEEKEDDEDYDKKEKKTKKV